MDDNKAIIWTTLTICLSLVGLVAVLAVCNHMDKVSFTEHGYSQVFISGPNVTVWQKLLPDSTAR